MTIASLAIFFGSCALLHSDVNFDKKSPNGTYRAKVHVWQERHETGYLDHIKVEVFKGQENILAYHNRDEDQYERSTRTRAQVVEWLSDNVLLMGRDRSDQPFSDELSVTNNTDEHVELLGIGFGKYQSLNVFDLTPNSKLTVYVSPEFKPDGTSSDSLGYSGQTQSGISFQGSIKRTQRKSPSEGPFKFEIIINPSDVPRFRSKIAPSPSLGKSYQN
ncbi:MAG TPA: hypothetical protein VFZ40_14030 [Pyrinomonadaceae bacterium]